MKANIEFVSDKKICHLSNEGISLILEIKKKSIVTQKYFGRKIKNFKNSFNQPFLSRGFSTLFPSENYYSISEELLIFSTKGMGDFRISTFDFEHNDNINHVFLKFVDWEVINEKPQLEGLPSSFYSEKNSGKTLKIKLFDEIAKIEILIFFTIFENVNIISRSCKIKNLSENILTINKAASLSMDFYPDDFSFVSLSGSHTNEANLNEFKLHPGVQKIESNRGASSPQHHPFIGLKRKNTDFYKGDCFGFHLIYSGSFLGEVELSQYDHIRVQLSLNPESFKWKLKNNETFVLPEVIINFSDEGLNKLSSNFHYFYNNNLIRFNWQNKTRPLLINSWETMYFNVDEEKILNLAKKAKEIGVEMIVVDDGWFKNRNDDFSGLGDWEVDPLKFPKNIFETAKKVKEIGLQFGLWFEPEMINMNSELFKRKPEWVIKVEGYKPTASRNQYVLDLSNDEVIDYLIKKLDYFLESNLIEYIKWDMNRHITDIKTKDKFHKYILGLYKILETLTSKYPNILFESCSSGGGRIDPGMFYYMPQCWASDNSEPISRTKIQSGYSLLYPPYLLTNHISTSPNHQIGRVTDLKTRFDVGRLFNLGLELDLFLMSQDELDNLKEYLDIYKKNREKIMKNNFYQLQTLSENDVMWISINENKTEFHLFIMRILSKPGIKFEPFKLNYLNPDFEYENLATKESYFGDELMYSGIHIPRIRKDFQTFYFNFKKKNFNKK